MESISAMQLKLAEFVKKEKQQNTGGKFNLSKSHLKKTNKGASNRYSHNDDTVPLSEEMIQFMESTMYQVDSDGVLIDTVGSHLSAPLDTGSLFFPTGALITSNFSAPKSTYSAPQNNLVSESSILQEDESFLDHGEGGYGIGKAGLRACSILQSTLATLPQTSNLDKFSSRLNVLWMQRQAKFIRDEGKLEDAVNILQDAINEHLGVTYNPIPGFNGANNFTTNSVAPENPYENIRLGDQTMTDNPMELLDNIKQNFFLYDTVAHLAADKLQRFYHKRFLRKCALVTKIGKWFRGFRVRVSYKRKKDMLNRCAKIIQRQYRWHLKLLHRLATKIKRWYKLRKDVYKYHQQLKIYQMARNIQRVFRGYIGRRYAKYLKLRQASVMCIQRNYRAYRVRSERYFILHHIHSYYYHAILRIQCFVRQRQAKQRARKQLLFELLRHHLNQHKEQLVMKEIMRMMKLQFLYMLSGKKAGIFGGNENKVGQLFLLFMKRYLYCEELIMQECFLLGTLPALPLSLPNPQIVYGSSDDDPLNFSGKGESVVPSSTQTITKTPEKKGKAVASKKGKGAAATKKTDTPGKKRPTSAAKSESKGSKSSAGSNERVDGEVDNASDPLNAETVNTNISIPVLQSKYAKSENETFVTPSIIRIVNRYDDYYDGQISYRHFYSLLVDLQLISPSYIPNTHASVTEYYTSSTANISVMSSDQFFQYLKSRLDPYDLGYISVKEFLEWYDSKEADDYIDSILKQHSAPPTTAIVSAQDSINTVWSMMASWLGQFPSNAVEFCVPQNIAYRYYMTVHGGDGAAIGYKLSAATGSSNHHNSNILGLHMIHQYENMTSNRTSNKFLHKIQKGFHNLTATKKEATANRTKDQEQILQDVTVNGNWTVLSDAKLISQEIIMKHFYNYLLSLYRYGTANPINFGTTKNIRADSRNTVNSHKGKFTCCQCYQTFALFTDYYQHFDSSNGNCPVKQLKGWFFGRVDYVSSHKAWQNQLELQQEIQRNSEEYLYLLFFSKYSLCQEIVLWDTRSQRGTSTSSFHSVPGSSYRINNTEEIQKIYTPQNLSQSESPEAHGNSSSNNSHSSKPNKPTKPFWSMKMFLSRQEELLYHKVYPLLAASVEKNLQAKCIDILIDYLFLHNRKKYISEVYVTVISNILSLPLKKSWIFYSMIDRFEVIQWLKDYWIVGVSNYAILGKNDYTSITTDPRDDPRFSGNFMTKAVAKAAENDEQFADVGNNNSIQQKLPSKEQSMQDGYLLSDPVFPHYNVVSQENHYANSVPSLLSRKVGPRGKKWPIFTKYQFTHNLAKRLSYLIVRLLRLTYVDVITQLVKIIEFRGRRPRRISISDVNLKELNLHAISVEKHDYDYDILQLHQKIVLEFYQEFDVIQGLRTLYYNRMPLRPSIFSKAYWRREGKYPAINPANEKEASVSVGSKHDEEAEKRISDEIIEQSDEERIGANAPAISNINDENGVEIKPINLAENETVSEPIKINNQQFSNNGINMDQRATPGYFEFPESSGLLSTEKVLKLNRKSRHLFLRLDDETDTSYYLMQLYHYQSNLLHQQYLSRLASKYYKLLYHHAQTHKAQHSTPSVHPSITKSLYRIYIKYFVSQHVPIPFSKAVAGSQDKNPFLHSNKSKKIRPLLKNVSFKSDGVNFETDALIQNGNSILIFSILDWDIMSGDIHNILLLSHSLAVEYQNHHVLHKLQMLFHNEVAGTLSSQTQDKLKQFSPSRVNGINERLIKKVDPSAVGYFTYETLETVILSFVPNYSPSTQNTEAKKIVGDEPTKPFQLHHSNLWNYLTQYNAFSQFQIDVNDIWLLRIRQERRLLSLLTFSLPPRVSNGTNIKDNSKPTADKSQSNVIPAGSVDSIVDSTVVVESVIPVEAAAVIPNDSLDIAAAKTSIVSDGGGISDLNFTDQKETIASAQEKSQLMWNVVEEFYRERSNFQVITGNAFISGNGSFRKSAHAPIPASKKYLSYQSQLSQKFQRLTMAKSGNMAVTENTSFIEEINDESSDEENNFDTDEFQEENMIEESILKQLTGVRSYHPKLANIIVGSVEQSNSGNETSKLTKGDTTYMQFYPTFQTLQELEQQRLYREILTLLQQQAELDSYYLYSCTRIGRKSVKPMEKLLVACMNDILMTFSSALLSPLSTYSIKSDDATFGYVKGLEKLPFGHIYAIESYFSQDQNLFLRFFSAWPQFVSQKSKTTPKIKNNFFTTPRFAFSNAVKDNMQNPNKLTFNHEKYVSQILQSILTMFMHFIDSSCSGILDPWEMEHFCVGIKLSSRWLNSLGKKSDSLEDVNVPEVDKNMTSIKSLPVNHKKELLSYHISEEHTFTIKNQISSLVQYLLSSEFHQDYFLSWKKMKSSFDGVCSSSDIAMENLSNVAIYKRQHYMTLHKKKNKYWAEMLFLSLHRRIARQQSEQSLTLTYQGQLILKASSPSEALKSNGNCRTLEQDKKFSLFVRVQAIALRQLFLFLQTKIGKLTQFSYIADLQALWKDCTQKYSDEVSKRLGGSSSLYLGKKVTCYEIFTYAILLHCDKNGSYQSKVAKQNTLFTLLSSLGVPLSQKTVIGNNDGDGSKFSATNPNPMMLVSELPHVIDYLQTNFHVPFLPSIAKLMKIVHTNHILQSIPSLHAKLDSATTDIVPWISWDQVLSILCYYVDERFLNTQILQIPDCYVDFSPHRQYWQYSALLSYWQLDSMYHMKSIARQQAVLIALNFQNINVPETNYRCLVLGWYAVARKTKVSPISALINQAATPNENTTSSPNSSATPAESKTTSSQEHEKAMENSASAEMQNTFNGNTLPPMSSLTHLPKELLPLYILAQGYYHHDLLHHALAPYLSPSTIKDGNLQLNTICLREVQAVLDEALWKKLSYAQGVSYRIRRVKKSVFYHKELYSLYNTLTKRYGDVEKKGGSFLKELMNGISIYSMH